MDIKKERSLRLRAQLENQELPIEPRLLAEKVLEAPDEYDPILVWICTNYQNAMCMLDLHNTMEEVRKLLDR